MSIHTGSGIGHV